DMDPDNLLGNYLLLYCDDISPAYEEGITLLFAHLKKDSLNVQQGEQIKAGQELGRVGNTGNTSEPHLHLHAVEGKITDFEDIAYTGKGVPMTFNGKFFRRNDRFYVQ